MKRHYLYIRGLKKVNFTVFCVDDKQKVYYDKLTNTYNAYSSGQQVKRCIMESFLENLDLPHAPLTFDFEVDKTKLQQKEVTQPCDPTYPDQLIGGWMSTPAKGVSADSNSYKHRSPLSISPMIPLHPFLSGLNEESIITFDRSESNVEKIRVREKVSNENYNFLDEDQIKEFMAKNNATISKRKLAGGAEKRANGLYSFDLAIDLRKLFRVSLAINDKEMSDETIEKLIDVGWIEKETNTGKVLQLPEQFHEDYAESIADAIINWQITSNQSRTYDAMPVVAIAVSTNANEIPNAIMGEVVEGERKANLVIDDEYPNTNVFAMPLLRSFSPNGVETSKTALEDAKNEIRDKILEYYKD